MAKIRFFPYDITYKVVDEKPVIQLFGRTDKGRQICVQDRSFLPYFYVLPKKGVNLDELSGIIKSVTVEKRDFTARVIKTELVTKKLLGKEHDFIKVTVNVPGAVPALREEISKLKGVEELFEYDILFTRRYLIDKGIVPLNLVEFEGEYINQKSKVSVAEVSELTHKGEEYAKEPRLLAFDIETYNPFGKRMVPEENPVLMIAFYGKDFKKVITWKRFNTDKDYIEFVDSEAKLVERFKEVIESYKPDILAGYYSDAFDLPYIKIRARKNKVRLELGLDYSEIRTGRTKAESSQITGIVHLDVFRFIKKVVARSIETQTYDLNSVASELLGEEKAEVDLDELFSVWDEKPEQLEKYCEYNLRDAFLTYKLATKLMPNLVELVRIAGLPMYDVNRMGFSQLVEWYLLRQAQNFNEVAPNKPKPDEIQKRLNQTFEGAFVYEPKPGLYKDIVVFDYRSLYPTIISSHNIDPGTLDCDCCKDEAEIPVDSHDKSEKHWFCKKRRGFIPTIIEELITRRMRIKEMIKDKKPSALLDARQHSLKLLANSFYGYLGFYAARWYSIECARSVTAYGRYYIHKVIDKAEKEGFKVLYSDTDSVFLLLDGKSVKDALSFSDKINMELPGLMELEYEGSYPAGIFVEAKASGAGAKKKYALLKPDGTLKIRGFETIRRNTSLIAREVQEKVLKTILMKLDPADALAYVRDVIKKLELRKIPLEKVVIYTQLQKDIAQYDSVGPHVAVAQRMKKQGLPVGPGTIIKYVVITGSEKIRDRARLPEEVSQNDYDPDYYIHNQILPAVDKIFKVVGVDRDALLKSKEQSRLDRFF